MTAVLEKPPALASRNFGLVLPRSVEETIDRQSTVYAASGEGDCMVPLIPADATLAFDPCADVQPGDIVVVWFTSNAARRLGKPGWVKRLAAPLPPTGFVGLIVVEMLNPQRTLSIRSTDVRAVHKCVGLAQSTGKGMATYKPATGGASQSPMAGPVLTKLKVGDAGSNDTSEPINLELFDETPIGWAIVHAAEDNRNAPIIYKGEIVVVESNGKAGWYPTEGGLFLIEYVSHPSGGERYERRTRSIVQTHRNAKGEWHAGGIRRGIATGGVFYCSDGPYRDEFQLAEKLIGKVVGLLTCSLKHGRV